MFFKELGFTLKQIRKVIGRSDFDQLAALHSHRQALSREWEKIGRLLLTIDNTIKHMKGKKKMKDREFFVGFSLVTKGDGKEPSFAAEELVLKNTKRQEETLDQATREEISKKANAIYGKIADCLEAGLEPTSDEVQQLIRKHHTLSQQFHNATKQVYKALAQLYQEHHEYKKQLDPIHPKLAKYLSKAMNAFADQHLK
jgi:DNA-binding transcriptional MerR regulator